MRIECRESLDRVLVVDLGWLSEVENKILKHPETAFDAGGHSLPKS
jgi:hypothetical protein